MSGRGGWLSPLQSGRGLQRDGSSRVFGGFLFRPVSSAVFFFVLFFSALSNP